MKNILCIILAFLLSFNNICVIYADDHTSSSGENHGGSSGTFEDYGDLPVNYKPMTNEQQRIFDILGAMIAPGAVVVKKLATDIYESFKGDVMDKNENSIKQGMLEDGAISRDKNYIYINQNFVKNINQQLQDSVHALDGFYLLEPYGKSPEQYWKDFISGSDIDYPELKKSFFDYVSKYDTFLMIGNDYYTLPSDIYYYLEEDNSSEGPYCLVCYNSSSNKWRSGRYSMELINGQFKHPYHDGDGFALGSVKGIVSLILDGAYTYGLPFKIFYSKGSLQKYLSNGEKRTYVPKLPSQIIRIPTKVINNTPQITYNVTTENKTENDIQNEYNQELINYITNLYPSSGNPTPTPTPIISDGEPTPTPTPDWGDGSLTPTPVPGPDMTETNDWLKKIYELLEKFYNAYKEFTDKLSDYLDNNDAFFKKVSEYLEKYDGKLDQIIDALDKIAQGKDEGDEKGCQYDYKELSEFLTKLWNDSDKKFDDMIDLLEENNEYQEKMLSTLNSIKNILRAQSVMDTFKNRSRETANKAKEKFPTSVPWDIAMIVNAMDAEPEDPVFLLPIKIERLGIDEEIKVDLSTGEWEKLAKACRYMLTLLFILFMIKLSIKLFSGRDDD